MVVFDKWGGVVFETTEPDGRWNGSPLNAGRSHMNELFTWRLEAQGRCQVREVRTGTVQLSVDLQSSVLPSGHAIAFAHFLLVLAGCASEKRLGEAKFSRAAIRGVYVQQHASPKADKHQTPVTAVEGAAGMRAQDDALTEPETWAALDAGGRTRGGRVPLLAVGFRGVGEGPSCRERPVRGYVPSAPSFR